MHNNDIDEAVNRHRDHRDRTEQAPELFLDAYDGEAAAEPQAEDDPVRVYLREMGAIPLLNKK
ncbi:MAG: hypothetical protein GY778_00520, partial [bacterium]|nr:hypothetical protein [bacterium]